MTIQLNRINDTQYRILSGVDLGKAARTFFDLERLDNLEEVINVNIPDDVISVNSSFFSGLFQASILSLGEQKFREHYIFSCDEVIRMNVENGIFNIVKTADLLGGQT